MKASDLITAERIGVSFRMSLISQSTRTRVSSPHNSAILKLTPVPLANLVIE